MNMHSLIQYMIDLVKFKSRTLTLRVKQNKILEKNRFLVCLCPKTALDSKNGISNYKIITIITNYLICVYKTVARVIFIVYFLRYLV